MTPATDVDELALDEALHAAARETVQRSPEEDAETIREEARAEAAEIIRVAREAAAYRIDRLGRSHGSRRSGRLALAAAVLAAAAFAGAGGWALWSGHGAPAAAPPSPTQPKAAASTGLCPIPARYRGAFVAAARREGVPLSLLTSVAAVESRWQPQGVSPRGAIGLLQLLPSSAAYLHVDPYDWRQNVLGGARFLRQLLSHYNGNMELALASYDAGPYRVSQGDVPLETVVYVGAVMAQQAAITGCR